MKLRHLFFAGILFFTIQPITAQDLSLTDQVEETMLKATRYMVEEVSTNGGYLSHYTVDFSRRWGELEAYDTQIWLESPRGTVGMGDLFLDLYQATGDEYYYQAAEKVARALIWGQHESGGWNYIVDFAGDRSLKKWYETIGANAWGFEEYYHYYGNATMDDFVTAGAAEFLLRIYVEKLDPVFRPALEKAIGFILESQYPLGGWPQRYPLMYDFSKDGLPDYSSFYTFNDNVAINNINFLINCYKVLGEKRFLDPIRRGMNFYLISLQGNPQAGWGQQYNMELEVEGARTFEPAALLPGASYRHAFLLMDFYKLTGDRKFLARIPDVVDWLERSRLPREMTDGGRFSHATFIELGTNRSLFVHREGTGVLDGRYWVDYSDKNPITHYGFKTSLDLDRLKEEYRRVNALSPEEATEGSPLVAGRHVGSVPPQATLGSVYRSTDRVPSETEVREIIASMDSQSRWVTTGESNGSSNTVDATGRFSGTAAWVSDSSGQRGENNDSNNGWGRWLTTGEWISNPYTVDEEGRPSNTAMLSNATGTAIRDSSDQLYISNRKYRENMELLKNYLLSHR